MMRGDAAGSHATLDHLPIGVLRQLEMYLLSEKAAACQAGLNSHLRRLWHSSGG
jgi:hypothetical protein